MRAVREVLVLSESILSCIGSPGSILVFPGSSLVISMPLLYLNGRSERTRIPTPQFHSFRLGAIRMPCWIQSQALKWILQVPFL